MFAALLLSSALGVAAADLDERAVALSVAEVIENNYFDPGKGASVADSLRELAESGELDDLDNRDRLARALTDHLYEQDRHFVVQWEGDTEQGGAEEFSGPRVPWEEQQRLDGHGFRTVEVLPGNVGYIEMGSFAHIDFEDDDDPARRAANGALAITAETDALIFDLRGNGGGAPSMVGYLASAFVAADADIYNNFTTRTESFSERPDVTYPEPFLDKPVYVLTSTRTGSAAEALPYTLQAAGRAVVVGQTTAGAANPGSAFDALDGFTVFVSTGAPINPRTGTNWEAVGVVPDVETASENALAEAYGRALAEIAEGDSARRDARWALEALRAEGSGDIRTRAYEGRYGKWSVTGEGGTLFVRNRNRPLKELRRLQGDVFFEADNPGVRYTFVRERGKAKAMSRETAFGSSQCYAREGSRGEAGCPAAG